MSINQTTTIRNATSYSRMVFAGSVFVTSAVPLHVLADENYSTESARYAIIQSAGECSKHACLSRGWAA